MCQASNYPSRAPSPQPLAHSPLTRPCVQERNKQIIVLGLDGAGKTSILHFLALNRVQRSVAPTQGFNAVCISTQDHQMEFLERDMGLIPGRGSKIPHAAGQQGP
nr:ADP-ribosylation factor-like protein 9 isoform X6 [Odocoileus virginianus texanus]